MALLTGTLKAKLILASVGLTMAMTPVVAQAKGGHGPRIAFETLDADGNGSITEAELQAHNDARFTAADTDGNGALSRAELEAQAKAGEQERREHRLDRMMERLDADKDGALSKEELAEAGGKRKGKGFARMDKDGNGEISKAEYEEMGKKRRGGKKNK